MWVNSNAIVIFKTKANTERKSLLLLGVPPPLCLYLKHAHITRTLKLWRTSICDKCTTRNTTLFCKSMHSIALPASIWRKQESIPLLPLMVSISILKRAANIPLLVEEQAGWRIKMHPFCSWLHHVGLLMGHALCIRSKWNPFLTLSVNGDSLEWAVFTLCWKQLT